jgi:glycine/D-amino acid oxidase-like deaminating enzyme
MKVTDRRPVVVLGGGILGCSIALHLADRGADLVLVDAGQPAAGASAVSFASISAFGMDPVAAYELASAGMNSWARFAARLDGDVGFRRGGQVRWTADPADGARLTERVARAQAWGYPIRLVSERQLRELLPAAEPGPVSAATHAPHDAQVDPPAVLAACRAALEAAGARLLLGPATVRVVNDGVRVRVGDETLTPSATVLATGPSRSRWRPRRASTCRSRRAPACWS